MPTTTINATTIHQLRAALQVKLEEFAKENGLAVGSFRVTYGETDFTIAKLIFAVADENATVQIDPRFRKDLERYGWQFGLTVDMIGKHVTVRNPSGPTPMEFRGMRASKAVLKDLNNGKDYLYGADVAARLLGAKAAA